MATSGRAGWVPVRINPGTWAQEVDRYRKGAAPRLAAERERRGLERDGLRLSVLERCAAEGDDGTSLQGLLKVYVPNRDAPPSERPYGFVLVPTREGVLALVAFGERQRQQGPAACISGRTSGCTVATPTSSRGSRQTAIATVVARAGRERGARRVSPAG